MSLAPSPLPWSPSAILSEAKNLILNHPPEKESTQSDQQDVPPNFY